MGGTKGEWYEGGLTDATVQAHSAGSRSYYKELTASSYCPLHSRVKPQDCSTLDDTMKSQLLFKASDLKVTPNTIKPKKNSTQSTFRVMLSIIFIVNLLMCLPPKTSTNTHLF